MDDLGVPLFLETAICLWVKICEGGKLLLVWTSLDMFPRILGDVQQKAKTQSTCFFFADRSQHNVSVNLITRLSFPCFGK